jgi:hypothetical protein
VVFLLWVVWMNYGGDVDATPRSTGGEEESLAHA